MSARASDELAVPSAMSPLARQASELRSGEEPKRRRWAFFWRLARAPRKLKLTREGKYYLGITLGVGFAAINTGNNLLYLLLGMLLSLIVVSGVMSELSLRQLTVKRRLPLRAQVGRAHLVEIEVFNHKGRVPSYAIEVEDLRAGQPADKRCFFLKISPSSAQVAAYRRTPARRGRDHHTGFRIATRFPFGLFEKSREVDAPGDLVIYPAVDPIRVPVLEGGKRGQTGQLAGRGSGDDIYTVRPMREGDDPRDIYWRKSTAANSMILRERVREARPDVELTVDNFRPEAPPKSAPASRAARASEARAAAETAAEAFGAAFERRIREVASRSVAHIKRGDTVIVRTSSGQHVRADKNVGADPILRFLALLESVEASTRRDSASYPYRSAADGLPIRSAPLVATHGAANTNDLPAEKSTRDSGPVVRDRGLS